MATDPMVHIVPEEFGDTLTAICGQDLNGTDHTGHFTMDPNGRRNCSECKSRVDPYGIFTGETP